MRHLGCNQSCHVYVIIGHRGAGKTTWAESVCRFFKKKNKPVLFLDTDRELEKKTNQSISQIFKKGEKFFRKLENQCVKECIKKAKDFKGLSVISIGAGYSGPLPSFCKVIHLKRADKGRIFLDRPRLKPRLDSLAEYQYLYRRRNAFYIKNRDFVFERPEHFQSFNKWDEVFFGEKPLPFKNAVITLNPKMLSVGQKKKWDFFLEQKLKWNIRYFEIRDDLCSKDFFTYIFKKIPKEKLLLSFRKKNSSLFFKEMPNLKNQLGEGGGRILGESGDCPKNAFHPSSQKIKTDWPIEWGVNKKFRPDIYSLHQRKKGRSLKEQLNQFSKHQEAHLKLAIEVFSFKELWQCHQWWKKDPIRRSFHPRSEDGRWIWHRSLFGPHQPLYFICEEKNGHTPDQPTMAESVRLAKGICGKGFAGLLGDPVWHSATPYEQSAFFKKYGMPVTAIPMKEDEMTLQNIKILEKLGLRFSAVTSPLKNRVGMIFKTADGDDSAVNTMILTQAEWRGFNTDSEGARVWLKQAKRAISQNYFSKNQFKSALEKNIFTEKQNLMQNKLNNHSAVNLIKNKQNDMIKNGIENKLSKNEAVDFLFKNIAVWGGGGIRPLLQEKLPQAVFYSARTGKVIWQGCCNGENPIQTNKKFKKSAEDKKNILNKARQSNDLAENNLDSIKNREKNFNPAVVIWAVGRSRMSACVYPPKNWRPLFVWDVHYSEDSPGRQYALQTGADYFSGWSWFQAQAKAQRKLFQSLT